eukprot:scaffold27657_cov110-Isochrysis_galbana.AAC.1
MDLGLQAGVRSRHLPTKKSSNRRSGREEVRVVDGKRDRVRMGGGPNCGRYSAGAILRYRALFTRTGHSGVLPTPCHGVTSPDCRPAGVNGHTSCQGVTSPGLCGGGRLKPRPSRSRISSRVRGLRRS